MTWAVLALALGMGPAEACKNHPGTAKCPNIYLSASWAEELKFGKRKARFPAYADVMQPQKIAGKEVENDDLFAAQALSLVGYGLGALAWLGRAFIARSA